MSDFNLKVRNATRYMISIACVLALGAFCCMNLAACSNKDNASSTELADVKIGTLATEDILPFWVAENDGLFAEAGINASIEVFQSATELIAALSCGDVQYAMTDPMVSASIFASGTPVQIEWITLGTDASQGRFGIMSADDSISSLKDLAGVEIGVGSNTILEYVMDTLMKDAGIDESKIKKNELQKLPVRYEAMRSGKVKAAALPASLLALGQANGCHVVADDTTGENISQSVMIVRSDFLNDTSGAGTVDVLKQVWNTAADKINASPESYRSLLVQKANLSDDIADSYKICKYPKCQLPSNKMIDPILSWMQKKGYLEKELSYNESDGTFQIND